MATKHETQDKVLSVVSNYMREGDRSELATIQLLQTAFYELLGGTAVHIDALRSNQGAAMAEAGASETAIARFHTEALTRRNLAITIGGLAERFARLNPVAATETPGEMPLAPVPEVPEQSIVADVA